MRALMLAAEMLDEHDESELYFPEVDAEVISTLAATSANSLRIFSIARLPGLPIEAVLPLVKCCRDLSKLILCDQCFGTVHNQKVTSRMFSHRPSPESGFCGLTISHSAFDASWVDTEHAPFLMSAMPSWVRVAGGRQRSPTELMRLPWNITGHGGC